MKPKLTPLQESRFAMRAAKGKERQAQRWLDHCIIMEVIESEELAANPRTRDTDTGIQAKVKTALDEFYYARKDRIALRREHELRAMRGDFS